MHIVSGIILFLMQLMIAISFVEKSNQSLMKDDWQCMRCKMTRHHSLSIPLIWIMPRYSFGQNKPKEQKEKNIIIGEPRPKNVNDKIQAREVMMEKTPDGKESLKITVKASRPRGQESSSRDTSRPAAQARPVRPVVSTGQTGQTKGRPRTVKSKRPEGGTRKVNE